ncbi:MAG TPA: hypothetical protein P5227_06760 [Emcibacteraceae bacterium]|nr:hypothetical protein [Emcibacteraceae bacterium]
MAQTITLFFMGDGFPVIKSLPMLDALNPLMPIVAMIIRKAISPIFTRV